MVIVGELINASRKEIERGILNRDGESIRKVAVAQHDAGADYIDVNAGVFVDEEADYIQWLIREIQAVVDGPCCIDSPSPKVIEAALGVHEGTPMINSISLEKDRYEALLPMVAGTDMKVVALCMSDEGMPETTDDRLAIADKLINRLSRNGVPLHNIYVDPLVQPVATNASYGIEFLHAVEIIKKTFDGVHTICGLSNISYGLPVRELLNQVFAVMAVAKGLDALIVNPLNKRMIADIIAAETLGGRDEFCASYLSAFREKRFEL